MTKLNLIFSIRLVNVWTIGKTESDASLSGHDSAISAVTFDPEEEKVIAGGSSGVIKVWDLKSEKLIASFEGHKKKVTSVDYHPLADFIGSGSVDRSVRIWDLKRKRCIQKYTGHQYVSLTFHTKAHFLLFFWKIIFYLFPK